MTPPSLQMALQAVLGFCGSCKGGGPIVSTIWSYLVIRSILIHPSERKSECICFCTVTCLSNDNGDMCLFVVSAVLKC